MFFFSSLYQRYDTCIIICVYWFELFSQVSNVAHGPLVFYTFIVTFNIYHWKKFDNLVGFFFWQLQGILEKSWNIRRICHKWRSKWAPWVWQRTSVHRVWWDLSQGKCSHCSFSGRSTSHTVEEWKGTTTNSMFIWKVKCSFM